jgi:hypothetical protein
MLKRAGRSPFLQKLVGNALAGYLLGVRKTSSFRLDPPDLYERLEVDLPAIVAMWHGQHFVMPFARPPSYDVRVMISRSADGEINAIAASKLGLGLIRASGAHHAHQVSKRGGLRGFIEAMRAEVTVPVVSSTPSPRSRRARTSGREAFISPTLAACSQTSGPSGRGREARPKRSPRRASSSLPRRALRAKSSGSSVAMARPKPR